MKTLVAATAVLALFITPAAQASGVVANPKNCTPMAALEHPFARWADAGFYVLHPGGDMETGLKGWTLSGGAAVVAGDDGLGVRGGSKVLSLPAGATVTTSPICIDETFTHARVLARSTVAAGSTLNVDVLYTDSKGVSVVKGSKSYAVKTSAWAPSTDLNIDAKLAGAAPVQFRFTAPKTSSWQLDDFYVDPRARG